MQFHTGQTPSRLGWVYARWLLVAALAGFVLPGCQTAQPHMLTGKVVFADGKPAAGAEVSAWGQERHRLYNSSQTQRLARTLAARDGSFTLRLPGWVQWSRVAATSSGWAIGWSAWTDRLARRPVELKLGEPCGLSGIVTDESGKPLAGALVRANLRGQGRNGWLNGDLPALQGRTDGQGRFALNGLPVGVQVRLEAIASGCATIDSWAGQPQEYLTPNDHVELKLPPAARLEVQVVSKATSRPVKGVEVGAMVFGKAYGLLAKPVPGREGTYAFDDLPAGRGMVFLARREGLSPRWLAESHQLLAKPGQTATGKLVLVEGQPCQIAVLDAQTRQAVANATLYLWNKAGLEGGGVSGRDGIARCYLTPGEWEYRFAMAPGYESRSYGRAASRPAAEPFLVQRGKAARGEVLLKKAPRAHGIVRDIAGAPAADVEISVLADWGGAHSDKSGRFELLREWSSNPPGSKLMLVAWEGGRNLVATASVEDLSNPVELTLRPAESRAVHVTDAAGKPLPRAQVTATLGWADPNMPTSRRESVTDESGLAKVAGLCPELPASLRVSCRGYATTEKLLEPGRASGEVKDEFRLTAIGPELPPAKAERIEIPKIPGGCAIWGAVGSDARGHVWCSVMSQDVETPSAHLFEYDPASSSVTDRGDVVGQLKAAGVLRKGDQQMKIHTRFCQLGDYLYFASMDEKGEDGDKEINPTFGGHLWRMSLKDCKWEHLNSVPEALIALAIGGGKVYTMGYFGHVLYQYDPDSGKTASVRVGSLGGHVSRNIIADARGHVFVPRLFQGQAGPEAALVEFDTELKELAATPLPYYFSGSPKDSHGIISLMNLPDGSIIFATRNGFLSRIHPAQKADQPARIEHVGWFHPDGPHYVASMHLQDGRHLMADTNTGFDQPHQWISYDLLTGIRRTGPVEVVKPAGLYLGRCTVYGSMARDQAGNAYFGGVISPPEMNGKSEPVLLKVSPPKELNARATP